MRSTQKATATYGYTVYKHTAPNNKIYIGITKQPLHKRWLNGKGYQKQEYFYRAIIKYGWDNIKHEVLYTGLTKKEAEEQEINLISKYKSNQRRYGYNISLGGNLISSTPEIREKIRISNSGKHPSLETREKFRKRQIRLWKDPEYREKQVKIRIGKPAWNKGLKTSIEVREKQRQAKLNKYVGAAHWNSKKVLNVTTGEVFNSFGEIARKLNLKNASHIVQVCKGQRASAYGCKWSYL